MIAHGIREWHTRLPIYIVFLITVGCGSEGEIHNVRIGPAPAVDVDAGIPMVSSSTCVIDPPTETSEIELTMGEEFAVEWVVSTASTAGGLRAEFVIRRASVGASEGGAILGSNLFGSPIAKGSELVFRQLSKVPVDDDPMQLELSLNGEVRARILLKSMSHK